MVSPEIEKKLSDLSSDYIYNEGLGNIILLAISAADRKMGEGASIPYEIPAEIADIRNKADKYITELEDILNGDGDRFKALEEIGELKKKLTGFYKNIYDYYSEWNMLSASVNDETAIRKYKEEHLGLKKVEYDMFYTDCINFLTGSENISELRKYTAQLLKCMPMRMARAKFFDIVLRSLRAAFDGESEDCIRKSLEAFKRGCVPSSAEGYGKIFPEIAQWIESKKETAPALLDDEKLAAEYEDFGFMLDSLQKIEDYFTEIYDDLNSLIIVLYLNFTFDELTEQSPVYSDLFHAVVDIMTGETPQDEAEALVETLKSKLEEAFEPIIDKINDINDKEISLIDKIGTMSALSEDTQKSISAEGFIRGIYYSNINDEIFDFDIDPDSPTATKDFAEEQYASFISFMQDYYKDLPMHIRKSNMLMLLGSIPVSMDIPDTMDYVKSSVENCIDVEQRLLIIDKAGEVFISNGFSYQGENDDDECGCHDHHHGHGHDCGCHDHHDHDHDCGCHDHHDHDHDCGCHDHHDHDHECGCHDHHDHDHHCH